MMRTHSIWRLIGKNMRLSGKRSSNGKQSSNSRQRSHGSQRSNSKGFWTGVSDTVLFQPHKSETLPMWRDMYKLNRQISNIERGLYQPSAAENTWLGSVRSGVVSVWHGLVDEMKALLTELAFHILTLVLIIVLNLAFFGGLFWLIGVWLER